MSGRQASSVAFDWKEPGLFGLILLQVGKTVRELFRDKRVRRKIEEREEKEAARDERLARIEFLAQEAKEEAQEAREQSESANRKVWRMEHEGQVTPDPVRLSTSAEPKTYSGPNPLLKKDYKK